MAEHIRWMKDRGLSAHTIRGRQGALRRLRAHAAAPLLSLTRDDIMSWRESLDHLGPKTIAVYVSHVRSYYEWLAGEGKITASPACRIPVPRTGPGIPRPIGTEDLYRAVREAPPRIRIWLILAAWCGLRCKEIALLRAENLLLTGPNPAIIIAGNATKGIRGRVLDLSQSPFVITELITAGLPRAGWLFSRADRKPGPNQPHRISQLISEYFTSLGIPASAHMLRHWFATGTLRATHDLQTVQHLLGHKNLSTTQVYVAWDQALGAAAMGMLPVPPVSGLQLVPA